MGLLPQCKQSDVSCFNGGSSKSYFDRRYKIAELISSGESSRIYLARHIDFSDQLLAMKVLNADAATDPLAVEAFRREVLAAYCVTHPNIVRVYEYMCWNGLHSFTMEYVAKGSLAALPNSGMQLSVKQLLRILDEICTGVKAIHDTGLVHANLHSNNILIGPDGTVKIADFGSACRPIGRADLGDPLAAARKSRAPLSLQSLDERSDIFSIGVIGYQLVTGVRPFRTTPSLSFTHGHTLPSEGDIRPPDKVNPRCPRLLSSIIERCLEVDPEQRYQSTDELSFYLKKAAVRSAIPGISKREAAVYVAKSSTPTLILPSLDAVAIPTEEKREPAILPAVPAVDAASRNDGRYVQHIVASICLAFVAMGMLFPSMFTAPLIADVTQIGRHVHRPPLAAMQNTMDENSEISMLIGTIDERLNIVANASDAGTEITRADSSEDWISVEQAIVPPPGQSQDGDRQSSTAEPAHPGPATNSLAIAAEEEHISGRVPENLRAGWYVRVDDTEGKLAAARLVPMVTKLGCPATLQVRTDNQQSYYRLFAGPLATQAAAALLSSKLGVHANGLESSVTQIQSQGSFQY